MNQVTPTANGDLVTASYQRPGVWGMSAFNMAYTARDLGVVVVLARSETVAQVSLSLSRSLSLSLSFVLTYVCTCLYIYRYHIFCKYI